VIAIGVAIAITAFISSVLLCILYNSNTHGNHYQDHLNRKQLNRLQKKQKQSIQQPEQQKEPQSPPLASNSNNDVTLLSSSDYEEELGYLHVIGEVENSSPDSRHFIKVTSSFYDSSNKIVGTSFTYTDVDILRPGEKSPFDIILNNREQSNKASSYKLSVSSDNSEPKPSNLKITMGDNYYDDLGYVHVLGEVTNQGASTGYLLVLNRGTIRLEETYQKKT
jgi:hypothetical protein